MVFLLAFSLHDYFMTNFPGKTGNFMCKFVFNGFDAKNHVPWTNPDLMGVDTKMLRWMSRK